MATQRIFTQNATLVKLYAAILRLAWHITLLVQVSFLTMRNDRKKKYEKKRTNKTVSFIHKDDSELLEWANSLEDFSGTVKKVLNNHRKGEK